MNENPEEVFSKVKNNIIEFFREEKILNDQIDLYFKEEFRKDVYNLSNLELKGKSSLLGEIAAKFNNMDKSNLFSSIEAKFEEVSNSGDYDTILKLFNIKEH